jgi:small subunit ribosomal protein S6
MPRYELMYLLGSSVAETDVPGITSQVLKAVEDAGGTETAETNLGKKKLAYPIKKTRNGTYVVVNFTMDSKNVNQVDAKVRSLDSSIIRYLVVNLEEHFERMEKDKIEQAKMIRKMPAPEKLEEKRPESSKPTIKLEDIDEKMLDEKIEKALSEDLTK